jgi:serine/threonine-protein kinase HipA
MGKALAVDRAALLGLASEAEVAADTADSLIDRFCRVAEQLSEIAEAMYLRLITQDTLRTIQRRIDENINLLR